MNKLSLKDLKNNILERKIGSGPFVFVYEDNAFLATQYINAIADLKNLPIEYVTSIDDLVDDVQSAFDFFEHRETLKVYKCKSFKVEEIFTRNASRLNNVVILCNKLDEAEDINTDVYYFDKLKDWQVIDYMKVQCKGLDKEKLKWLYSVTSNISKNNENIYRIDNELKKINCFSDKEQEQVFKELNSSNGYQDLSSYSIYSLTNAILKRDYVTTASVLNDLENIDVEPYGLITILCRGFRQIIDIQLGKNATAESLGMNPKQFFVVKQNNVGRYTDKELINIYKFLTGFDYRLKSGLLDMGDSEQKNRRLIDYIISEVM